MSLILRVRPYWFFVPSVENLDGVEGLLSSNLPRLRKHYYPSSSFRHGLPEPGVDTGVSGRILRAWMPAIRAGMTEAPPTAKIPSNIGAGVAGYASIVTVRRQAEDHESLHDYLSRVSSSCSSCLRGGSSEF
jgi:hypothetical protein